MTHDNTDGEIIKPRKSPCASCPYRKNVPSGVWDESEYQKLPRYDGDIPEQLVNGGTNLFMCHQQDGCLCSGWLSHREHPSELLAIRLAAGSNRIDAEAIDYSTDVPLFHSGKAAAEHGMREIEEPSYKACQVIKKITIKNELDQE